MCAIAIMTTPFEYLLGKYSKGKKYQKNAYTNKYFHINYVNYIHHIVDILKHSHHKGLSTSAYDYFYLGVLDNMYSCHFMGHISKFIEKKCLFANACYFGNIILVKYLVSIFNCEAFSFNAIYGLLTAKVYTKFHEKITRIIRGIITTCMRETCIGTIQSLILNMKHEKNYHLVYKELFSHKKNSKLICSLPTMKYIRKFRCTNKK